MRLLPQLKVQRHSSCAGSGVPAAQRHTLRWRWFGLRDIDSQEREVKRIASHTITSTNLDW